MMKRKDKLYNIIFNEMFSKFKETSPRTIGVEIEIPIISINNSEIKMDKIQELLLFLINEFKCQTTKLDNDGNIIMITNMENEDKISLEYSKNTIEFSLKEDINLFNIKNRMDKYLKSVQDFLLQFNYKLDGKGINPNYKNINKKCLNDNRYLIIEKILTKNNGNPHILNQFCSYICSIQTHITPSINELTDVINTFTGLEWIKSILFANSYMDFAENSRLARDYLWKISNFGIENTGTNSLYKDNDDLINSYKKRKLHYIERDNKFYTIDHYSLEEYMSKEKIIGIDINNNSREFTPKINDFSTFRSYKNAEVTRKGTIEIRSDCTQDLDNLFEIVAFNVGAFYKYKDVYNILSQKGYLNKSSKLREEKNANDFVNNDEQSVINIICNIVFNGLCERGYGEEVLLKNIKEMGLINEKSRALVL